MVTLSNYIFEHLNNTAQEASAINEAFGSVKIQQLHASIMSSSYAHMIKEVFKHTKMQWDKITDDDVAFRDHSNFSAKEMKVKHLEETLALVFWLTSNNKVHTITYGANVILSMRQSAQNYKAFKSLTSAKKNSASAYVIHDAKRFSTIQIQKDRFALKSDVLAWKTNLAIAKENKARYEKLKKEKLFNDNADFQSISDKVGEYTQRAVDALEKSRVAQDWEACSAINYALRICYDNLRWLQSNHERNDDYVAKGKPDNLYKDSILEKLKYIDAQFKLIDAYNNAE